MPIYTVQGPDGRTYDIEGPAGAQEADIIAAVQSHIASEVPSVAGRLESGNIDLAARPVVKNEDGSISTVRSMSANFDGQEVLIPTVSDDGRILSDDEAIANYQRTGKHLGKFSSPEAATAYAEQLHRDQERMYASPPSLAMVADASPIDRNNAATRSQVNRYGDEARRTYNATDEMSTGEQVLAGIGKSVVDTGEGLTQLATRAFDTSPTNLAVEALTGQSITAPILERQYAEAAKRREIDAPLMETSGGVAGNVVGTLSQVVGPGALAKIGTGAASPRIAAAAEQIGAGLMPATVRGNVIQGAALGAAQPVTSEEERLQNAGVGAGASLVGAAIPGVVRGARALLDPLTEGGSDRIVARTLAGFADDVEKVRNPQASPIPGVQPTLAEATLDPGMARLQRTLQSASPEASNQLDAAMRSNNAARVAALEGIAGDDAAMAAAESARKKASQKPLKAALSKTGVNAEPVVKRIDDILASGAGERDAVRNALQSVRTKLLESDGTLKGDVERLYGIRKQIDDLMAGKAAGDNAAASAARRELTVVKKTLDRAIFNAAPEFRQYLAEYVRASQPINQMEVGRELLRRGSAAGTDPTTGVPILAAGQFQRAARNLDDVAAAGTGFRRARADNILAPEQRKVIDDVADSLARYQFAQNAGRAAGSDTFQNLASQNVLTSLGAPDALAKLGPVNRVANVLDTAYKVFGVPDRLKARLTEVIANPQAAAQVLAKLPRRDREAAMRMYTSLTGRSLALGQE